MQKTLPSRSRSSQNVPTSQISNPKVFNLQILASSTTSISQDTLPALLGLDTLSLSLPSSRDSSSTRSESVQETGSISKIIIQNIPSEQIHLLFSSARLETSIRNGLWIYLPRNHQGSGVVSVRWVSDLEELQVCDDDDDDDELVFESGGMRGSSTYVKVFDYRRLLALKDHARAGSYDGAEDDSAAKGEKDEDEWMSLTQYLIPAELDRILPGLTKSEKNNQIRTWQISTLSSSQTTDDTFLEQDQSDEETLHLTPISFTRTFPPSSIGPERTKWARDRSWYLSSLIDQPRTQPLSSKEEENSQPYGQSLLSELTLSFLISNLLGNHICQQQWKRILALSFTCRAAPSDKKKHTFFTALLNTLAAQILYTTAEQDPTNNNNNTNNAESETANEMTELKPLLHSFAQSLSETTHPDTDTPITAVRAALNTLNTRLLSAGLNWDLDLPTPTSTPSSPSQSATVAGVDSAPTANLNKRNGVGLGRRILRMREGFGDDSAVSRYVEYGYGGFGDDGDEGDEEEEEEEEEMGEYAPVLVDLHGLLADDGVDGDGVDGDGDCGRRLDGCEGEDDDDDDDDYDDGGGEEMDLRY